MNNAFKHFRKNDPVLYGYAFRVGNLEPIAKENPKRYFYRLCREIIGQQLHSKAAHTIFARFQKLFPRNIASPKRILTLSHQTLRGTGMSHAKARYIRNLAEQIASKNVRIRQLDSMTDEEAIASLTGIEGIGRWTAEMFLIFALGRSDVFSYGDLALKRGMQKIYKLRKEPSPKRAEQIIKKWSPYKTYASRILWASLKLE